MKIWTEIRETRHAKVVLCRSHPTIRSNIIWIYRGININTSSHHPSPLIESTKQLLEIKIPFIEGPRNHNLECRNDLNMTCIIKINQNVTELKVLEMECFNKVDGSLTGCWYSIDKLQESDSFRIKIIDKSSCVSQLKRL